MYALFTGRRAYSGGGGGGAGAVADPDLQIRGGGGHPVPEKEVGREGGHSFKKIFRPYFGLKIRGVPGLLPWIRH